MTSVQPATSTHVGHIAGRAPRLIFDFPSPNGGTERLSFTNPIATLIAEQHGDVLRALADAEWHAKQGRFVAGFVSYDAAPAFEPAMRIAGRAPTPLVWFGVFDRPRDLGTVGALPDSSAREPLHWTPNTSRTDYDNAIECIRAAIGAGEVYQVNHTIRLRAPWAGDALALYERLRTAQETRYGAFVDIGRFQVVSAAPELFFARVGDRIETRPMKGTARRGRWPDEDRRMPDALARSEKDRAENLMIVDLLRNDIGRLAEIGSVHVPALLTVERYPTVWQLTSTVAGTARSGVSLTDIFAALFPCGSVTGAPKIAATHQIARLEPDARGVYCGAVGIIRPGGDCCFNVAIRTAIVDAERAVVEYGVGGGITFDSTAAGEYDEALAKSAILTAPVREFALIETMRLVDGVYVRRDRHLARLSASAAYFGFADPTEHARAALDAHAAGKPRGCFRARLLASRNGAVDVDSVPFDEGHINTHHTILVSLAHGVVDSADVFLFHKTTDRTAYDRARADDPAADDVILMNERGELTELTTGNLVIEVGGRRYTPPLDCGLLAGVFCRELLESAMIEERVLRLDDLHRASAIWRVSSLREWTPARLSQAGDSGA